MRNALRPLSSDIKTVLDKHEAMPPFMREILGHWMRMALILEAQCEKQAIDQSGNVERFEHFAPFLVVDNDRGRS